MPERGSLRKNDPVWIVTVRMCPFAIRKGRLKQALLPLPEAFGVPMVTPWQRLSMGLIKPNSSIGKDRGKTGTC